MIQARGLTKRFKSTLAVDDLTFDVLPGRVTGFLGPNGSGKSTTMRLALGLDRPTTGTATVNGHLYRELRWPLNEVGALLEVGALHSGRRARDHLRWLARTNAIPLARADEALELVGLASAAARRAGTLSLGMRQRLGIAAALLGDPSTLLFDEPVNGLDPEGIVWVRTLLKSLASEGRTVLVSSHLMSEMALTADHLVVIGRGRLIADASVEEFVRRATVGWTRVVAPDRDRLREALERARADVVLADDGALEVRGVEAARVGELAHHAGIVLHELTPRHASLEEAYMDLTAGSVEFHAPHSGEAQR